VGISNLTGVVKRVTSGFGTDDAPQPRALAWSAPAAANSIAGGTRPPALTTISSRPAAPVYGGRLDGHRLRVIVFTDIEGCTPLMHRLGDAAVLELWKAHERLVRDVVRSHDGIVLKAMGDGFMLSFTSVTQALAAMTELQRRLRTINRTAAHPVKVRVGINAGEPIAMDGDLFGSAVVIAQRVSALARGGQVFVSEVVRQIAGAGEFEFDRRGRKQLRGINDRIGIFELRWGAETAATS
jgi:class 3 adenylate cyclase